MLSLDSLHAKSSAIDITSSPRISFSSEFLDESNFISICPGDTPKAAAAAHSADFEFLSTEKNHATDDGMTTADELFREGKLLPFWQMHCAKKLSAVSLGTASKSSHGKEKRYEENLTRIDRVADEGRIRWLLDDDPSPRPPKCTVLWKELLRLKKQRPSTLLPSSSSSVPEQLSAREEKREGAKSKEKVNSGKRVKKVSERIRAANVRIRPVINVPICATTSTALPPLFSSRKGRQDQR